MRAGGEATFLVLAWERGADPYCVFNSLDAEYRPLAHRHPCPGCFSVRTVPTSTCSLCGGKQTVDLPLEEPGEPTPPPHPRRMRNFIYGIAAAAEERNAKRGAAG